MTYNNEYLLKAYLYQDGILYETGKRIHSSFGPSWDRGCLYSRNYFWLFAGKTPQEIVDLGMASFQFKHTIEGDINVISQSDIDLLLKKGSREIKR